MEKALAIEKKRTNQLEGDLSIAHANLNIKRCARIQAKKLSDAQKLNIKSTIVELFKDSKRYQDELEDYVARTYLAYLDKVI